MKVVIDLTALCRPVTGTERYSLEMTKALLARERGIEFSLLFRKFVHPDLVRAGNAAFTSVSPFASQLLTEQIWLPRILQRLKPDIVHFPFFAPGPAVTTPYVMTVYDANLWKHPETLSWKTRWYTKPLMTRALPRAKRVLIISDAYKDELISKGKVQPENVLNVGIGVTPFSRGSEENNTPDVRERYNIRGKYLLAVGTLEPRKNYPLLIRAFAGFLRANRADHPTLVLAGRKAWDTAAILRTAKEEKVEEYVYVIGYVPDADLGALYGGAECLVCPSVYEGFGLPVFEALSCGTPVICSDIPPFSALLRGIATMIDPSNVDSITDGIQCVVGNQTAKARATEGGKEIAKRFSWQKVADEIAAAYKRV